MDVLVIGATGGTGRVLVDELFARGHHVTAFSRSASTLVPRPGLTTVDGDATRAADVDAVVPGHDAVVVTLGITENPLGVRLRGARGTADDVRSRGTRTVVEAMRRHGVDRLVVQTSYGVGPTRDRLRVVDRLFFALLLAPQIADTEVQEQVVRSSGLDWVLAQPVHLKDAAVDGHVVASPDGEQAGPSIGRPQVAAVLADVAEGRHPSHVTLALSVGASVPTQVGAA